MSGYFLRKWNLGVNPVIIFFSWNTWLFVFCVCLFLHLYFRPAAECHSDVVFAVNCVMIHNIAEQNSVEVHDGTIQWLQLRRKVLCCRPTREFISASAFWHFSALPWHHRIVSINHRTFLIYSFRWNAKHAFSQIHSLIRFDTSFCSFSSSVFSVSGISSADSSCKKSGCVRNSRIFRFTCLLSKLGLDTGYTVTEDELLQIASVDLSEFEDKSTGDNPMYEDVWKY